VVFLHSRKDTVSAESRKRCSGALPCKALQRENAVDPEACETRVNVPQPWFMGKDCMFMLLRVVPARGWACMWLPQMSLSVLVPAIACYQAELIADSIHDSISSASLCNSNFPAMCKYSSNAVLSGFGKCDVRCSQDANTDEASRRELLVPGREYR
jgi:hypothetical protein